MKKRLSFISFKRYDPTTDNRYTQTSTTVVVPSPSALLPLFFVLTLKKKQDEDGTISRVSRVERRKSPVTGEVVPRGFFLKLRYQFEEIVNFS